MTESRERLCYGNKVILAPMVRVGTLPMRLLALDYGADIVYTEELIDFKMLRSIRRENDVLGTVDYIDRTDGTIIFRTTRRESSRVVFQLGTSDATRALKVAQLVEQDVAGIDINMGCPKSFSLMGGMGAALLTQVDKAKEILETLVKGLTIPVSCKIRVFEDLDKTMELCNELVSTGISAIAVHGRTVKERPQHSNRNEMIRAISERLPIPVIANGGSKEIEKHSDIGKFKKETGCSSVMIARSAEWNCSIFRKEGLLPIEDVIKSYLKYAIDFDNSPSNTKYCVQNILRELQESLMGKQFLAAQSLEQICAVFDMDAYCREKSRELRSKGLQGRFEVEPVRDTDNTDNCLKRKHEDGDDDVTLKRCAFLRNGYSSDTQLPKTRLLKWLRDNKKKDLPVYDTWSEDKLFRSIVTVDGQKYSSTFWEKNKKWAEQGAALVFLLSIGLIDEVSLIEKGHLMR
ncbi:tRNA-dihydrouridine(20) synthase [NAD(P)+]-like [Diachasmimorpha longicaudata]|uniref:tRNA-dihydrouridine(20) synthase [NAD(P)+]-like n=1 Tax=Diachasmimorpha longicaudata TaxID=58733 RepID=UPI0030B8E936